MKKILIAVLMFSAVSANAGNYFRLIDPNHPQISIGRFVDFSDGKHADGASVALITHSQKDGCAVPVFCTDWTPLSAGGALDKGLGGSYASVGTSANLLPATKTLILSLINATAKESQFTNVKSLLAPPEMGTLDITVAFGPHYGLVFPEGSKPVWMLTWFLGAAWVF